MSIMQDTRPVEEYQVSHIPEAVQVDPGGECELTSLGISVDIATTGRLHLTITPIVDACPDL